MKGYDEQWLARHLAKSLQFNTPKQQRAIADSLNLPNVSGGNWRTEARAKRESQKVRRDYKQAFLSQLQIAGVEVPVPEFAFAAPERRWRFDFAYLDLKIAIEYQGGVFFQGAHTGHTSTKGITKDFEKFTEASLRGWMLILIDAGSVRSGKALEWVERAIKARKS